MANYKVVSPGGHELSNGFKPGGDIVASGQVNGLTISKGKGNIILQDTTTGKSYSFFSGQLISVP